MSTGGKLTTQSKNQKGKNDPKEQKMTLEDGTVVTLKPLPLSTLRKFMRNFTKLQTLDTEEPLAVIDLLTDCAAIALARQLPEATAYLSLEGEEREEARVHFDELINMDQVSEVNRVMGGVDFNSPNLEAGMTNPASEEGGTT
jgi:hypothetical protein